MRKTTGRDAWKQDNIVGAGSECYSGILALTEGNECLTELWP